MSFLDDVLDARKKLPTAKEKEELLKKQIAEQRQKLINFKKFFGEEAGRGVMLDLMNRFHIITKIPDVGDAIKIARLEGQRDVVLYLLEQSNIDVEKFDNILKGNFS